MGIRSTLITLKSKARTSLCDVWRYSAMREWAAQAKKLISEKGIEE